MRNRSILLLLFPALAAALLLASGGVAAAQEAKAADAEVKVDVKADADSGNVFADSLAYAQRRCVKIYGAQIGRVEGYATGLLISPNGLVLTGQGVFLSGSSIRVVLPDGSKHLAQVFRRSDTLQAAILKIAADTPEYFEIPEKMPAEKGDWVMAVTNLFKVADGTEELSVNLGIISLRTELDARRGTQDVPYKGEVLIVDAITSNPGAEGGALVTVDGKLAGMVGKIIESKSTNTRLNYAVPADLLHQFVTGKLTDTPEVVRGHGPADLGIRLFTLGATKRTPAYVDAVVPGSPAEKAGLRKDDLILTMDGEFINSIRDYKKALAELKPGEEIVVVVKRGEMDVVRVTMTPVEKKTDEK